MMTSYCDRDYYLETYQGEIVPQDQLDKWLLLASNRIRLSILYRNITGWENEVKDCTCEIADILYSQDKRRKENVTNGSVISESVGDYSRTLANTSVSEMRRSNDSTILDVLELYLGSSGLLYRGFDV